MENLLNLVIVAGLLVSGSGFGLVILHIIRLKATDSTQHLLIATGLGLGAIAFLPFGLAWAQHLTFVYLLTSALVLFSVGIFAWILYFPFKIHALSSIKTTISNMHYSSLVLILFIVLLALLNLLAALAPVTGVDELIYRVADASTYLKAQGFVYMPSKFSHQQPQQVMMIQMWGMSLGSDSASQVIQWAMGLLFIAAIVDLARRFMPLTAALVAGVVIYCASDVVVLSARAVPDLSNSLFLFLGFTAFKLWLDTKNDRWLFVVGLLSGFFAAGSRLTGAYGAIALTAFVILYTVRDKEFGTARILTSSMLIACVAFLMVLPWLIKSFVMTGNPVWPFMFDVFGAKDFTQSSADYLAGSESRALGGSTISFKWLVSAPWDLTFNPHNFRSGIFGPLILSSIPVMFVTGLNRNLRKFMLIAIFACVIWYFSFPRLRALIPVISLMTIASSYGIYKLWISDSKSILLAVTLKTFIGLSLCLWILFGLGTQVRFHYDAVLETLGIKTEDEFLSERLTQDDLSFYWYDEYMYLNKNLPSDSKLLLFEGRGYYLDFQHERYFLIAQNEPYPEKLKDLEYVHQRVDDLNIDFVVLWPEFKGGTYYEPANWVEDSLHSLCESYWEIIYQNEEIKVCEVWEMPD